MFNPTVMGVSFTWTVVEYRGRVINNLFYYSRSFDLDFFPLPMEFMLLSASPRNYCYSTLKQATK